MRTISLRQPVVRALLGTGWGVVGRNWPVVCSTADTVAAQQGAVGLHVSTQGNLHGFRRQVAAARRGMLSLLPHHTAPKGHVVAQARVVALVCARTPDRAATARCIVDALRPLDASVDLLQVHAWMAMFDATCAWWWLLVGVQPVRTPVLWRGVMSQFPVDDAVFR